MPLAQVHVSRSVLNELQRRAMVKGSTDMIVGVEGLPPSALPFVIVLVNEVPDGGWGVGSHGYTRPELPELVAGHPIMLSA